MYPCALTQIPWAAAHYLDFDTVGSLATEVEPTMRHMLALWDRLHGRFDELGLIVHAFPEGPRRLREADHNSVASWVTLVLGEGVIQGSASARLVEEDTGTPVSFDLRYTRYGGYGTSRLLRIVPTQDLTPGERYSVVIEPGAQLTDGTHTELAHTFSFQVECRDPNDILCPPVTISDDPIIAKAEPTSTPSATASRSFTPEPTATVTGTPSHTATMIPTATFTAVPSATFTSTVTLTPTVTASHTHTPSPTMSIGSGIRESGCQLNPGATSAQPLAVVAMLLGGVIVRRRRR